MAKGPRCFTVEKWAENIEAFRVMAADLKAKGRTCLKDFSKATGLSVSQCSRFASASAWSGTEACDFHLFINSDFKKTVSRYHHLKTGYARVSMTRTKLRELKWLASGSVFTQSTRAGCPSVNTRTSPYSRCPRARWATRATSTRVASRRGQSSL